MSVVTLLVLTLCELIFIYAVSNDILFPAFVFAFVFVAAELNLLTNVQNLKVSLGFDTTSIIVGGIMCFTIGSILAGKRSFSLIKFKTHKSRVIDISKKKAIAVLAFNIFAICYILREVYNMTVERAGYSGSVLGALGIYAEVSKFQNIDMKVSIFSTLLTALCEAEGYVFGYILSSKLVNKEKISLLEMLCFLTVFLSTFCQGSRGGIWMIISSCIVYIILYRKKMGVKKIGFKLVGKVLFVFLLGLIAFQVIGVMTGKFWNVSFYEYLSVYLGDPIINLDIIVKKGIQRTPIWGYQSFGALVAKFYSMFGLAIPYYPSWGFQHSINGHNLGNVYTIFASLIADFGVWGMYCSLVIIGYVSSLIYNIARHASKTISVSVIFYGYILTNIGFSFFSNKFCENVSVYHLYVFLFVSLFAYWFTSADKVKIPDSVPSVVRDETLGHQKPKSPENPPFL